MKAGGFDAVIGNPPYLNITVNTCSNDILDYYKNFKVFIKAQSKNLFAIFIEKCIKLLSKNAYFSFIVPEGLAKTRSYFSVREIIFNNTFIESLLLFDSFVFKNAMIGNLIFVLSKKQHFDYYEVKFLNKDLLLKNICKIQYELLINSQDLIWKTEPYRSEDLLLEKMQSLNLKASERFKFYKGMVVKNRKEHLRTNSLYGDLPFLLGKNIDKYKLTYKLYTNYDELLIVGGTKILTKHMECPRVLIRRTGDKLCAVFTNEPQLIESTLYIVTCTNFSELLYLLGLLNSKLLTFFVKQKMITNKQAYPQILMTDLKQIPYRVIDFSDPIDKSRHDRMVSLVDRMLVLHKQLNEAKTTQDKTMIQREIDATDRQIDRLVYELYDLTEEEIRIVEESVR
jgi:hypothetical protein